MASTADAEGMLRSLLLACNIFDDQRLASCLYAFLHPTSTPYSVETSLLSQISRFLKSRAVPDRKAELEKVYMQLITKDNGSLPDVFTIILQAAGDTLLWPSLGAKQGAMMSHQLQPLPHSQERATSSFSGPEDLNNSLQSVHSLPAMPPNPARRYDAVSTTQRASSIPMAPPSSMPGSGQMLNAAAAGARYDVDAMARPAPALPHSPARSVASTARSDAGSVLPAQPYDVRRTFAPAPAPSTSHARMGTGASAAYAAQPSGLSSERMHSSAVVASGQPSVPAAPPVAPRAPPHSSSSIGGGITVLDALLAYTECCTLPASVLGQPSGIRAQDAMAEQDRGLLRYGSTIVLRSGDPSGGFVLAAPPPAVSSAHTSSTSGSSPGTQAVTAGSGVDADRIAYTISHAVHGASMSGLPVRCGDPILLRHAASRCTLSVLPALTTPRQGQGVAYPVYASTEARRVGLQNAGSNVHGGGVPEEAWMIISPDALLTAVRVLQAQGNTTALPRPFLASSQRVLLMSMAGGSAMWQSSTVLSQQAAREAVLRLHCLQCGPAPDSPVFTDGVSTRLAALAAQHGRDGSVGNAGSLSPASLAVALAVQPPAGTLWSLHTVFRTSLGMGTQEDLPGSSAPRHLAVPCPPDDLLSRPALTGSHLLPSTLHASSHGPAGMSLRARAVSSLPVDLATRMRGKAEAGRAQEMLGEAQILEHTLDALLGSPGALISAHVPSLEGERGDVPWDMACSPPLAGGLLTDVEFRINNPQNVQKTGIQCDSGMAALVIRMLPIARHYVRCRWWVERRSRHGQGLVANAVAAAVHGLLREYSQLVVQLEKLLHHPAANQPALTLAQTWYFLQPSLRTLASLDLILYSQGNEASAGMGAQYAVGGQLVNVLLAFYNSTGDDLVRTLSAYLVERGSVPLLQMTDTWLHRGHIHDPYQEFFIAEGTSPVLPDAEVVRSDDEAKSLPAEVIVRPESASRSCTKWAWEGRFTLRGQDYVPLFLAPHAQDILLAGKYACALAECRVAAQDKVLSLAAKRAGVAAALASWAGLGTGPAYQSEGGEDTREMGATAALAAYASPTKLLKVPSAILGADIPVPQPPRALAGGAGGGMAFSRRTSHASMNSGPTSPTGVTGSVLDTVFETRKQSVATSSSYPGAAFVDMPAAGLPSSNAPGALGPGGAKLVPASPSQVGQGDKVSSPDRTSPSSSDRRRPPSHPVPAPPPSHDPNAVTPPVDIGPALMPLPHATGIKFSMDAGAYGPVVDRAYTFAARALLQYFMFASNQGRSSSDEDGARQAGEGQEQSWDTEDMTHGLHPLARRLLSQGPSEDMTRLLRLAGGGADLLGRLNTLKCLFLVCTGDWLGTFLEAADGEFGKPAVATDTLSAVSAIRLQHHFEAATRSSIAQADPYLDMVKPTIAACTLLAQIEALLHAGMLPGGGGKPAATQPAPSLKGRDVFCLDMSVPWPASLVLHRTSLAKYQLLFRHLCYLAYAQKRVERAWASQQGCKELDLRATLAQSHLLRHRMLAFLASVSYYLTVEVIEPLWAGLMAALQEAKTVDEVRTAHEAFLDSCLAHSLLTSPDLFKTLTKLQTLCLIFSDQITAAIERHRLSEQELDRRAGANKASIREREEAEKGQYYAQEVGEEEDGSSLASGPMWGKDKVAGGTGAARRHSQAMSATGGKRSAAGLERERRKARLGVQADAMRHALAQIGWQSVLSKSTYIFDTLLQEFLTSLKNRTRADSSSHVVHLLSRLDLNGFYSR